MRPPDPQGDCARRPTARESTRACRKSSPLQCVPLSEGANNWASVRYRRIPAYDATAFQSTIPPHSREQYHNIPARNTTAFQRAIPPHSSVQYHRIPACNTAAVERAIPQHSSAYYPASERPSSERASERMRHAGEGVMAVSPSERARPGELKGTSSERASVFGPLELSPTAGKQP